MKETRKSCPQHYREMEERIHKEMSETIIVHDPRPVLIVGVECEMCDEEREKENGSN